MIGEAVPLGPKGHLIHQDTKPRHRVKAALPNYRNKHSETTKMKRQGNMAQMKEQIKAPEKELNNMEISNLSDTEFKTLLYGCSRNSWGTSAA